MASTPPFAQLAPLEARVLALVLFEQSEKLMLLKCSLERHKPCDGTVHTQNTIDLANHMSQVFASAATELRETGKYTNLAIKVTKQKQRLIDEDVGQPSDKTDEVYGLQSRKSDERGWKPLQLRLAEMIGPSYRLDSLITSSIEKRLVSKWQNARINQQLHLQVKEQNDIYDEYLQLLSLIEKEKLFSLQLNYLEHATDNLVDQIKDYENKYESRMESLENEANVIQNTLHANESKLKAMQAIYQKRETDITNAKKRENMEYYATKIQRWWREFYAKRGKKPGASKKRKQKKASKRKFTPKMGGISNRSSSNPHSRVVKKL